MLDALALTLIILALLAVLFGPVFLYRHWRSRRGHRIDLLHCVICHRTLDAHSQHLIANGDSWCLSHFRLGRPQDYQVIYDFARANPPIPERPVRP